MVLLPIVVYRKIIMENHDALHMLVISQFRRLTLQGKTLFDKVKIVLYRLFSDNSVQSGITISHSDYGTF